MWLGFTLGAEQSEIVDGSTSAQFNPCPPDDSTGAGQVAVLWHTSDGGSLRALNVVVAEHNVYYVAYSSRNVSSGGFTFALTNSSGWFPCENAYEIVWVNPTADPTAVTIATLYNVTVTVPLL